MREGIPTMELADSYNPTPYCMAQRMCTDAHLEEKVKIMFFAEA